jgi:hypothetical protein
MYNTESLFDYIYISGPVNFANLIAIIGSRSIINEFYTNRQDLVCNPLIKVIFLFSIIYANIKHVKISIILFFFYLLFIDNYIHNTCNPQNHVKDDDDESQPKPK